LFFVEKTKGVKALTVAGLMKFIEYSPELTYFGSFIV
jgi:hypothetical protein